MEMIPYLWEIQQDKEPKIGESCLLGNKHLKSIWWIKIKCLWYINIANCTNHQVILREHFLKFKKCLPKSFRNRKDEQK